MIIEDQKRNVNNTNYETGAFQVNSEDPLLFWVMSNALYEHKERAVLRELAANGWDSHYEAGITEVPIRISLPTDMEPTLVVQDFGVGMSYKHLQDYYFAYFKSSKRKSKDSIGGYGIGCKTPFILSDTYTVTTVKEGLKTVAVANLDAGIPVPTFVLVEQPTDEPNGTTVSIPVDSDYAIANCKREAFDLFYQWPVQPVITLGSEAPFEQKEQVHTAFNDYLYLVKAFSYSIRPDERGFESLIGNFTIGMFEYASTSSLCNRAYAKYTQEINSKITLLKTIYRNEISTLNFKVNVGDLKLSPSRETVEDTDENADMLFQYFDKAVIDLTETVKQEVIPYINTVIDAFKDIGEDFRDTLTVEELKSRIKKVQQSYTQELYTTLNFYIDHLESEYLDNKEKNPYKEKSEELKLLYSLSNYPYTKYALFYDSNIISNLSKLYSVSIFYRNAIAPKLDSIFYSVVCNSNRNPKRQPISIESYPNVEKAEYIIVAKPSVVFNYASYHKVFRIVENPDEEYSSIIEFDKLLITKSEKDKNIILKNFPHIKEVSASRFEIPKTKRTSSTSAKTKPNYSPVFSVVKDFTNTVPNDSISSTPVIASDWYALDFPQDTVFLIKKYSNQRSANYNDATRITNNHFIEGNVVILVEGKQGEFSTKRAEKFFNQFPKDNVKYLTSTNLLRLELEILSTSILQKYSDALLSFDLASNVLDLPSSHYNPHRIINLPEDYKSNLKGFLKTFTTFTSLYRYLLKNSFLKYSLYLTPKEHRKEIIKLAMRYKDTLNDTTIAFLLSMNLQRRATSLFYLNVGYNFQQERRTNKVIDKFFEKESNKELNFLRDYNFSFQEIEIVTHNKPIFKKQAQELMQQLVANKDYIYNKSGD